MEKIKNKKSNTMRVSLIGALFLCIFSYFAYIERENIYSELNNLKLIPQPEKFTELYFENHASLPRQIVKNETISFSFTIHNLEGIDMKYPYVVYFKNNYGTTTVEDNIIFIKNNEYKTITESYTFKSASAQETLYVELTDQRQQLHFALSGVKK